MKCTSPIIISIACMLLFATNSYGEKKICRKDVPESILHYLEKEYPGAKHIHYYFDQKKDTAFYEVELTYKKEKLSLTFLKDATLYELEKKVDFNSLPSQTQANIGSYLSSHYKRYKITSVQFVNPHLRTEYELSIKARDESGAQFYEMYFNEKGEFMHLEEIEVKPIQTLF